MVFHAINAHDYLPCMTHVPETHKILTVWLIRQQLTVRQFGGVTLTEWNI
jgi:hypothetical protein